MNKKTKIILQSITKVPRSLVFSITTAIIFLLLFLISIYPVYVTYAFSVCLFVAILLGYTISKLHYIIEQVLDQSMLYEKYSMYSINEKFEIYSKEMLLSDLKKEISISLRHGQEIGFIIFTLGELLENNSKRTKEKIVEYAGEVIHDQFRAYDVCAYIDEFKFVIMCPRNNPKTVDKISRRIVDKLSHVRIDINDKNPLTIYMSTSQFEPETDFSPEIILDRLYKDIDSQVKNKLNIK